MLTVILVVHLLIAAGLVGTILMQRSEGGALGMGGGNSGPGLVSSRAAGNLLTRTTAILAAGFFVTSLTLAILANSGRQPTTSILDEPAAESPVETTPAPAADAVPSGPAVPLSK